MRIFLTVLILIFSLQSWSKADDIRDFQIEGISLGDSLLDYFSEKEIIREKRDYYKNKEYTPIEINIKDSLVYTDLSFTYKTNDKKYIIERMSGYIDYRNKDIKKCFEKVDVTANDIEKIFSKDVSRAKKVKKIWYELDPTGKSHYEYISFDFENLDQIVVACYDFSDESGYTDNFNIEIKTDKINKFLEVAYK